MKGVPKMSNSMYFFMEIKDREGNWHLVKYLENLKFNENDHTKEKYGETYYKLQYPFELKRKIWVGNSIRDAVRSNMLNPKPLPDDISTELYNIIEEKAKSEVQEKDFSSYSRNYYCIYFSELYERYEKCFERWKSLLNTNIESKKNGFIITKIEEAKNEIINSIGNREQILDCDIDDFDEGQEETRKQLCYEDSFDYAIGEGLEDLMEFREELEELRAYAIAYSGDKFINDNIRVYCFYE